jgi:hypothetical protein
VTGPVFVGLLKALRCADFLPMIPMKFLSISTHFLRGIHELHELPPRRRGPPRSLFTCKLAVCTLATKRNALTLHG